MFMWALSEIEKGAGFIQRSERYDDDLRRSNL
jgi:hypothetical protein